MRIKRFENFNIENILLPETIHDMLMESKIVETSVDPDTYFEEEPWSSDDEYIILRNGEDEASIGFSIEVDFDEETSYGDDYYTPTYKEIKNEKVDFQINDFELNEEEINLTPELEKLLIKVLKQHIG